MTPARTGADARQVTAKRVYRGPIKPIAPKVTRFRPNEAPA